MSPGPRPSDGRVQTEGVRAVRRGLCGPSPRGGSSSPSCRRLVDWVKYAGLAPPDAYAFVLCSPARWVCTSALVSTSRNGPDVAALDFVVRTRRRRVAVFERRDEQPRASRRGARRERFIDRFAPPRGADARQRGRLAFGVDLAHRRVERDAHVRHASRGFGQLRSYPGVFFLQVADVLDGGVRRELAQGGVGDRGALRVDEVAVRFERLELEGVRRRDRFRRRPREFTGRRRLRRRSLRTDPSASAPTSPRGTCARLPPWTRVAGRPTRRVSPRAES